MTRTAMDMQCTICSKCPLHALVFLLIGSTLRKTKGHLPYHLRHRCPHLSGTYWLAVDSLDHH